LAEDSLMTVAKEPGHRGEHEVTVKTIAQGRLGVSGEPVVTMLVCFITFAREAAGASGTRLSLRPCFFEGHCLAKLGRVAPRERGCVSAALFEIQIITPSSSSPGVRSICSS
jgi:hypothetical protein